MVFVVATICKSSFIFTTRVLYFAKTCLIRNNMEIHLIFTLWNNFKPLVSSNKYWNCIFGEDEKYVYVQNLSDELTHYCSLLACWLFVDMKYWPTTNLRHATLHFHVLACYYKLSNLNNNIFFPIINPTTNFAMNHI